MKLQQTKQESRVLIPRDRPSSHHVVPLDSQADTSHLERMHWNLDAELNLPTIDRTSHALTIHIHLHLTTPSHRWSLVSAYFTIISILIFISVFVAIWRVSISNTLHASASIPRSGSWSHRTSGEDSIYGESEHEEMEGHEAETENTGRKWAEYEFLAR